jgi:hypothetical protein
VIYFCPAAGRKYQCTVVDERLERLPASVLIAAAKSAATMIRKCLMEFVQR